MVIEKLWDNVIDAMAEWTAQERRRALGAAKDEILDAHKRGEIGFYAADMLGEIVQRFIRTVEAEIIDSGAWRY